VSLRQIQTKLCSLTYSPNCDAHFRRISSVEGVVDTGLQTKSWFIDKLGQKRKFGITDRAEKVHQEEPRPKRKCMEDDQIQMRHFRRFRLLEDDVYDPGDVGPPDSPLLKPIKPRLPPTPPIPLENDVYDPDDDGPQDSPLLKPLKPRLLPTPSPPDSPLLKPLKPRLLPTPSPLPDGSKVEDDTPVLSQGDSVLISLLGSGKAIEVARIAATELLAEDDEMSDGPEKGCKPAQL
jgi:hypothetical protein